MTKNYKVLGFAVAALALASSNALCRPIQIDGNAWGPPPANFQPFGQTFCTNQFTQVWTVATGSDCSSANPVTNPSSSFIQLLTIDAAVNGDFQVRPPIVTSGAEFRIRWDTPLGDPLAPTPFIGEISFYSGLGLLAGEYNFDFGYGPFSDGTFDFGVFGAQVASFPNALRTITTGLQASFIVGGPRDYPKYCLRNAGGLGQLNDATGSCDFFAPTSVPEPPTSGLLLGAFALLLLGLRRRISS